MKSFVGKAEKHKLAQEGGSLLGAKRAKVGQGETGRQPEQRVSFGGLFDAKGGFRFLGKEDISFEQMNKSLHRARTHTETAAEGDSALKSESKCTSDPEDDPVKTQLAAVEQAQSHRKKEVGTAPLAQVSVRVG